MGFGGDAYETLPLLPAAGYVLNFGMQAIGYMNAGRGCGRNEIAAVSGADSGVGARYSVRPFVYLLA